LGGSLLPVSSWLSCSSTSAATAGGLVNNASSDPVTSTEVGRGSLTLSPATGKSYEENNHIKNTRWLKNHNKVCVDWKAKQGGDGINSKGQENLRLRIQTKTQY